MKRFTFWTLIIAIAFSTGCTALNKEWKKKLPWSPEARIKSSKFETPSHMIAIWSPDVITQQGKPPTRGFGGRIYFYNDKNQAVPVEGQLVVYGYDDKHDPHQPGEPQRKFAFTPDQFTKHYSNSDLGASYSIWIPWDAVAGEQCNITLVPIFTATSGQIVMGQQAMNVLPGKNTPTGLPEPQLPQLSSQEQSGIQPLANRTSREGISAASFSSHAITQLPAPRLRTSTIHLTPALQRRLSQNADVPVVQPMNREELNTTTRQQDYQLPPIPTAFPSTPFPSTPLPAIPEPTAASPDGPNSGPPAARFEHSRFPVRRALGGRSVPPAPWTPPYPAKLPSALQSPS